MKTIYLIFSALLISISGFAHQSNLNGTITDDYGNELERAWVLVLNADDLSYVAGTVTDEKGNFAIEGVEEGDYVISVHHVSFDAPKVIGKWNNQSNLNELIKLQAVQNGKEVSLNKFKADKAVTYGLEWGVQKL